MAYQNKSVDQTIEVFQSSIAAIEIKNCIDELQINSNSIQHLKRADKFSQIDEKIYYNNIVYEIYRYNRAELKRITVTTPTLMIVYMNLVSI